MTGTRTASEWRPPGAEQGASCRRGSPDERAVLHLHVLVVEILHRAPEAELRALADPAHLPPVTEVQHQRPRLEAIGNVNGGAAVAEGDQGAPRSFEHQR